MAGHQESQRSLRSQGKKLIRREAAKTRSAKAWDPKNEARYIKEQEVQVWKKTSFFRRSF